MVGTAIRNSTRCAGRRGRKRPRNGRHNSCCSGLQYQPLQHRPYRGQFPYSLFEWTVRVSECYLSINMDTTYKKCIARFRVSSHRLGIETGRHQKPPIPADNRVCAYCPGPLLDDELHLITQCRYHLTERTKLYDTAKMHIAELGDCSNYDKFALIVGSQSAPLLVALGNQSGTYDGFPSAIIGRKTVHGALVGKFVFLTSHHSQLLL